MTTAKKGTGNNISFRHFLIRRQEEAGLSNKDLANAIGYESQNVVAMIRSGVMRLPLNKINLLSKALQVDKVLMLNKVLEERDPELLEVINETLGKNLITDHEMTLVKFVRQEMGGLELNIMAHPEFIKEMREPLQKVAKREKALHDASMDAIKRVRKTVLDKE